MGELSKNKRSYSGPTMEQLLRMGEFEDSVRSIAVGGLACDLGFITPASGDSHHVFGRLIDFARREQGLTVEQLSNAAGVEIEEILDIEREVKAVPLVRTVFQLAQVLKLPVGRLMEVAGLAQPRPEVNRAALRFAARSESTAKLSPAEKDAYEEFVKVLVESSDGV